jgi:hypothetical protein
MPGEVLLDDFAARKCAAALSTPIRSPDVLAALHHLATCPAGRQETQEATISVREPMPYSISCYSVMNLGPE